MNIDNRIYRLGESSAFRFHLEENQSSPAFVYESPVLSVRQEFTFIKTSGSSVTNGIQITFTLKNLQSRQVSIGLRMLVDTHLGEGYNRTPFYINDKGITGESLIEGANENYWVSRNDTVSLMGSIAALHGNSPDAVHFANWKRLNEAPWKTEFIKGRNFNYPPYSIRDSAVCYYYDPVLFLPSQEISYTIILAAEDPDGFEKPHMIAEAEPQIAGAESQIDYAEVKEEIELLPITEKNGFSLNNSREEDLKMLYDLMERLDRFIDMEIEITEEELAAMELTITLLKARYNLH